MKVRISEDFRAAYKKLKKRYKSLEQDFEHQRCLSTRYHETHGFLVSPIKDLMTL